VKIGARHLHVRRLLGAGALVYLAASATRLALVRHHVGPFEYLVVFMLDAVLLRAALQISRGVALRTQR
jgi:hypothetical protein